MEELLPNITARLTADVYIVESAHPLHILSSAVVGGGFTRARYILNRHVPKEYTHPRPADDMIAFAHSLGIHEPFVGLMTAAYLERTRVVRLEGEDFRLVAVATVGLSNLSSAGHSPPAPSVPGTINLMVMIEANLLPAAMVNAVITATEAKTATLHERALTGPEGHPATGTSTDAVVVACTGRGPTFPYAGPVTPVGWAIARAVRDILR